MKKTSWLVIACMCLAPATVWADDENKDVVKLESFKEKLGYSMGLDVGNYFKKIGDEISFEALLSGLNDAYQGNEPALSAEEIASVQREFGQKMQAKQQGELKKIREKNEKLQNRFRSPFYFFRSHQSRTNAARFARSLALGEGENL